MDDARVLAMMFLVLSALVTSSQPKHHRHNHGVGRKKRQHEPESFILDVPDLESGDWEPWSGPAACSRTCGGGVTQQTRNCRIDSREPCKGASKRYFSCNIQDCPEGSLDFRAEQCSSFNNVPFDDVYYTWIPYTKAPNKCELNCMPRGERFYYRHKDKVADGTRCEEEKLDICVDGKCLAVGCDHLLGSPAREDRCRECGGDGSTCNTVQGQLNMDDLQVGYNDLLLIPAGATNIHIQEVQQSNNYLAIRNESGHYYLNGNWRIDFPRSIRACGTIFHYERKPHGFFAPEMISALGPTTEPIYIVLLYQERNPGIEYEYSLPKGAVQSTDPSGYSWVYNDFGECSATCGGGIQTRNVWCAKRSDSSEVSNDLCNAAEEPLSAKECALEKCAPQWSVSEWGPCTETCGTGGTQNRQVICEQIISGGRASLVNYTTCEDILGPAPPSTQQCGEGMPCPTYHIGPWKPCDRLCGEGKQKRDVICFHKVNGRIEIMSDNSCPGIKPETEMTCKLHPCEGVDWVTTEWTGCEDKCGLGFETRQAYCTTEKGEVYPDSFCQKQRMPELRKECIDSVACKHVWFASQWSQCSALCGLGIQTRKVFCGSFIDNGKGVTQVDDSKCDPAFKYEDTKNCTGEEECQGNWFAGPWSACSKRCGGGQRTRKVICMLHNISVPTNHCDMNMILFMSENCNDVPCGTDHIMTIAPGTNVENEDEECDDDYYDELITENGVPIFSSTFEGSGTAELNGQDKLTSLKDLSSFYSDEMLSDEPISPSTIFSNINTSPTFKSSEATEDSSTNLLDISSLEPDGSGESSLSSIFTSSRNIISTASLSSILWSLSTDTTTPDIITENPVPSTEPPSSSELFSSNEMSKYTSQITGDIPISTSTDSLGLSSSIHFEEDSSSSELSSTNEDYSSTTSLMETTTPSSMEITTVNTMETTAFTEYSTSLDTDEINTDVSPKSVDIEPTTFKQCGDTCPNSIDDYDSNLTTDKQPTSNEQSTSEISSPANNITSSIIESSSISTSSDLSSTYLYDVSTTESNMITNYTTLETSSLSDQSNSINSVQSGTSAVTGFPTSEYSTSISEITTEPAISQDNLYSVRSTSFKDTTSGIWLSEHITTPKKKKNKRICKPKIISCFTSEFGCCYDNITISQGPFNKGCPIEKTCNDTKFGCCEDGVSPAKGHGFKGCPLSQCTFSLFGCCPDGVSTALGNNFEGCPKETTTSSDCKKNQYGCCPDGISPASGPDLAGCTECYGSSDCKLCNNTKYGCCPNSEQPADGPDFEGCHLDSTTEDVDKFSRENQTDCESYPLDCCIEGIQSTNGSNFTSCEDISSTVNCSESSYGCCLDGITSATGPDQQGCPPSCLTEPFGCCHDNLTSAHGLNKEGCCLLEKFGCCPDNISPAQGPQLEGCGCQYTHYGCCPDNQTTARGPNNQGCGCQFTAFGCCPNQYTPAAGPSYQGCPCYTYQFGCCPDGTTKAVGPNLQGCGCDNTEFGCCPDGRTPALDAGQKCLCVASSYGCCPDGISEAAGTNFEGCEDIPLRPGEQCTLQKDRGPCRDFTVKWFYDTEYGGCSRFWYGGCEGNENRFITQEECKQTCVEPSGRDVCYLPKIEGPCDGYYPTWYYDADRKQCGQFVYGGCLGNGNQFQSRDDCEALCVIPDTLDACEQDVYEGPCIGNFTRWYFDQESESCKPFNYGGCKGNNNNFLTELSCQQKCLHKDRSKDECSLPINKGNCLEKLPRWFFDVSENRCMPFYYSGCDGNGNRFLTRESCEKSCPPKVEQHTCLLPAIVGDCHNYTARWYYDSLLTQCRQFYYGGCGGNDNNFFSQEQCQQRCQQGYVIPEPLSASVSVTTPQYDTSFTFNTEWCFLPDDSGDCKTLIAHWFYDSRDGVCKQFLYGGCGGNGNRFNSRQECELRCGNVQDVCTLPRVVGPCDGYETQFYYNHINDSCNTFDYGGCLGNANRFASLIDCEKQCKKGSPLQPSLSTPPLPVKSNICYLPVDKGPCTSDVAAWFFDTISEQCQAFIYGGCEGNANRFSSIEQCERQCGTFHGQDVCNTPVDVGPCEQHLTKWYYDSYSRTCQSFHYSGCGGTANRFSSLQECESICLHREEMIPEQNSSMSYLAICKLPMDSGPCMDGEFTRWAFDDQRKTCVGFIYHGCAGNLNRFKTFQACLDYCLPGNSKLNTIDVDSENEKNRCASIDSACARLTQCPYGVERWVDSSGCDNCRCYDPCVSDNVHCSPDSRCTVVPISNSVTKQKDGFKTECRAIYKPGECPQLSGKTTNCVVECSIDADCGDSTKCCPTSCGTSCLEPIFGYQLTPAPSTDSYPGGSTSEIHSDTLEVEGDEGYFVTLRCAARGNPTPTIEWMRSGTMLSKSGGRYRIVNNGTLQIVGLVQSDAGEYTCVADNGIGEPARKTIHVRVRGPKDRPAEVMGDDSQSIIVTLGSPAVLQCYAYGYPAPAVTWWRGERMLPIISRELEQRRDLSLVLNEVKLTSLGPYTCQAYNGKGRAASWTLTLKAVGPVYAPDPNDVTYNQYLVPLPRSPLDHQHSPHYRPIPGVPPTPNTVTVATARVFVVPVKTNITMDKTTFPVDSDISIPCYVDGYPLPKVVWFKDNQMLHVEERIQISESSRLTIIHANSNDSGTYRCEASNQYSSSISEVNIRIEGIYVDPLCTDNTFFADCHLVVRGKFCTHKYYGKFCCKSCTLAGQLPSYGPHLDILKRTRRSLDAAFN